ncbi:hypothetical protein [Paenibacillus sp. PCH8]|uniref:hypothetical protein n=1 Tax=Paenibacillus sp. PCH8 TaxID=2066524 RepID=UPI0015E27A18|nr:hypothetical protein [Paenibacillus sp. PCH8]
MLNEHACTDHVTENGDAALLSIGTVVYELKGYKAQFRVVENNSLLSAEETTQSAAGL